MLTTAARAELEQTAASVTTRMFVALMQRDAGVRELVTDVLPEVFPWVAFLSTDEVLEFVLELVTTMRAADSLHNPAPVVQVIQSWRHTAEVLADPELAAVLTADSDLDLSTSLAPRETQARESSFQGATHFHGRRPRCPRRQASR
ncbi:hypothetical protein [Nocardia asteroides]|uniref:hypothetical protein n=1 Tax=Nocardia asteroides TaxID=1824 RepID=UPI001E56ADB7|nr:hypothetical protein [Nocardia asteroides]UGT59387.1 hypothetical protein LTT61_19150 [Nocardia asteroides]